MVRIISLFQNKKLVYAVTLSYAAAIFLLSHQSQLPVLPGGGQPVEGMDKLQHFIEYAAFALLVFCSCWHIYAGGRGHSFMGWLLSLVYAALDEVHQAMVPGRDASMGDLAADVLGIAAAYALWLWRIKPLLAQKTVYSPPPITRR